MKRLAVVVTLICTLAAGCGSDDSSTPGANGALTPAKRPPTQADADAALLVLADMPAGWTAGNMSDDDDDDDFCKEITVNKKLPPVAEAEADFTAGQTGPFVGHGVAFYENEAKAKEAMSRFATPSPSARSSRRPTTKAGSSRARSRRRRSRPSAMRPSRPSCRPRAKAS